MTQGESLVVMQPETVTSPWSCEERRIDNEEVLHDVRQRLGRMRQQ